MILDLSDPKAAGSSVRDSTIGYDGRRDLPNCTITIPAWVLSRGLNGECRTEFYNIFAAINRSEGPSATRHSKSLDPGMAMNKTGIFLQRVARREREDELREWRERGESEMSGWGREREERERDSETIESRECRRERERDERGERALIKEELMNFSASSINGDEET
ncbi:hypothetical protein Tco_0090470 [Tanacetum coccineum]